MSFNICRGTLGSLAILAAIWIKPILLWGIPDCRVAF
jgi:hypothetical protein